MGEESATRHPLNRIMDRRRFLRATGMTALTGIAAACSKGTPATTSTSSAATGGGSPSPAGTTASSKPTSTTTIRLTNDFLPDLINAWYWVGRDNGYFEAEGLNVEMQNPPAALINDPRLVVSGQADVLMGSLPPMIFARAAGLKVISIGCYLKQAAEGIIFDPSHIDLKGPRDLRGKKYGNFQVADWKAEFKQFLKSGGMTESDVTIVNPGYSTPAFIQAGKIDAGDGLAYGEKVTLSLLTGKEASFLNYNDFGTPPYPWGQFVVTQDYASKNPDAIKAFLRAASKSMKKYFSDTAASQKAFQECCITGPTATGTLASTTAKFTASLPYWFNPGADTAQYMVNDGTQWKNVLAWAPGIGLATASQIEPAENYFTNEFITPEAMSAST